MVRGESGDTHLPGLRGVPVSGERPRGGERVSGESKWSSLKQQCPNIKKGLIKIRSEVFFFLFSNIILKISMNRKNSKIILKFLAFDMQS